MPSSIRTSNPCGCCGGGGGCTFDIPNLLACPDEALTEYADEATATAAIDDYTAGCLAYFWELPDCGEYASRVSKNASVVSGDVVVTGEVVAQYVEFADPPFYGAEDVIYVKVYLLAGLVSIDFDVTSTTTADLEVYCEIWDADFNYLSDTNATSPSSTTFSTTLTLTVPSDGYYYVGMVPQASNAASSFNFSHEERVYATGLQACTIRAAYDDGGGTSYLVCES